MLGEIVCQTQKDKYCIVPHIEVAKAKNIKLPGAGGGTNSGHCVAHVCNSSTQEGKAGWRVQGQPTTS